MLGNQLVYHLLSVIISLKYLFQQRYAYSFFPVVSSFYTEEQQILISCILSVTVLTLFSSIVASIISAGYPREKMEFLRHYSVFNIVSSELNLMLG